MKQKKIEMYALVRAAEEGNLDEVKRISDDQQEMFMMGELAMRKAALNGHIDVVEYFFDYCSLSLLGTYGNDWREIMEKAPDEVKAWYEDHAGTYICTDREWMELVEKGEVTADALLEVTPYQPAGDQHLLLTAAAACEFPAALDVVAAAGRLDELTAEHFMMRDDHSTLLGYLIAFGNVQDAFRPEIWTGRHAELEKFWVQVPPFIKPEIDLSGIFEDARHLAILKKIRAKKWPRLKGTGKDKKALRGRSRRS